jgi:hypothetical protein
MVTATNHPARQAAHRLGEKRFIGLPCAEHPNAERWVSSGNCVTCSGIRSREQKPKSARERIGTHPARTTAQAAGERTWIGPVCRHGHVERYTKSGSCAVCMRAANGGARHD